MDTVESKAIKVGAVVRPNGLYIGTAIVTAVVTIFLLFYRLDNYPLFFVDEGAFLRVSKTLAVEGVYADRSSEGYRYNGAVISTGPTVIVPTAILFKIFGVNPIYGRLVSAVYGVLMLLALWYFTNQLFNRTTALLAVIFALASPALSLIFNARAMMGDIPGVFFILMGMIFWVHPKGKTIPQLILAGVFFGLACVTKFQFILLVMPCIAAGFILNIIWYRQHKWYYYFIPGLVGCIVAGLWFVYVIVILPNPANASQNIAAFRSAGSLAFTFDLRSVRYGLNYLASIDAYAGIVIAGLIAGFVFSVGKNKESQDKSQLLLLIVLNFGMYLLSVVEWKRYSIPGLALIPIFIAALVYRLIAIAFEDRWNWRSLIGGRLSNQELQVWIIRVLAIIFVLNLAVFPLISDALTVKSDGGNQATFAVATYLKDNAKPDALIETYEPELATVSDFKFHFPLQASETTLFRKLYRERTSGDNVYNFHDYVDPDYVIVGRLGVWANFYPPELLTGYEVAQKIGDYTIWKKVST